MSRNPSFEPLSDEEMQEVSDYFNSDQLRWLENLVDENPSYHDVVYRTAYDAMQHELTGTDFGDAILGTLSEEGLEI